MPYLFIKHKEESVEHVIKTVLKVRINNCYCMNENSDKTVILHFKLPVCSYLQHVKKC